LTTNSKERETDPAERAADPNATKKDCIDAAWLAARSLVVFFVLWAIFYGLFRAFPYLSTGSEVIYRSKLNQEINGSIFPSNTTARRLLICGDSHILAGFIPAEFDRLAAADGFDFYSYNSGYPARWSFVPELGKMVEKSSGVPNILLLTMPWGTAKRGFNGFRLLQDDHDIADRLFPFRYLIRDTLSFLVTSKGHGGPWKFYGESRHNDAEMIQDRGYYFISELSEYPNNTLPDDFHLATDQPDVVADRSADSQSEELRALNRIVDEHHIQCYFVPTYARVGQQALPPDIDRSFAEFLNRYSSCKLLGPDYYLYPNRMFSDAVHLNRQGAKLYTKDIYKLLAGEMIGH
jgi:hypothetical protein